MRRLPILTFPLLVIALALFAWGAQLRQVAMVDLPGLPGFDEVAYANGMLVMAHPAANTVEIFDPARRRVVAEVKDMAGPHGLAVNPRAAKLYVANS
jgi:DNA-binding beta-propeller fold protein YncE